MMKSFRYCFFLIIFWFNLHLTMAQDWINYNTSNSGLVSNYVKTICIDGNGIKWFGTDKGLCRFDGTSWSTIQFDASKKQTLADDQVNDIVFEVTRYGPEIWLATGNGVSVMDVTFDVVTIATPYRTDNTDLVSNRVFAAAVDSNHVKWFGTDTGVSSFTGSEWGTYTTEKHLSHNFINAIEAGPEGYKFIATHGRGVSRLQTEGALDVVTSASPYDAEWSGLLSDTVLAVFIDGNGYQWFGGPQGAAEHRCIETKECWEIYTTENGLINNYVQAIAEDKLGRKWFGTPTGVSCFDGTNWKSFTINDGLISNNVHEIALDHDGTLWLATDNGISHARGELVAVAESQSHQPVTRHFQLFPNYPNPFNPSTQIQYELHQPAQVRLTIYNMQGQTVRILVNQYQAAGRWAAYWDGHTENHQPANSGVYVASLQITRSEGTFTASEKMLLLK